MILKILTKYMIMLARKNVCATEIRPKNTIFCQEKLFVAPEKSKSSKCMKLVSETQNVKFIFFISTCVLLFLEFFCIFFLVAWGLNFQMCIQIL